MTRHARRFRALLPLLVLLAAAAHGAVAGAPAIRAALARGDVDAAIAAGEAAVAANPADAPSWSLLGAAYGRKAQSASVFAQLGLARKCKAAFERAVELAPGNLDARSDLVDYYVEAPGIAGGSMAKAKEQAREIAKLDAVAGHLVLGRILAADKDLAGAEVELKQALASSPTTDPPALALTGLYVAQKRWADASALWRTRLAADSRDMLAHYQLARLALFSETDLDAGIEHLKLYLTVPTLPARPTWADAHWRLGLLYEKRGRKAEALAEFRAALRIDPAHQLAKKDLERLGG